MVFLGGFRNRGGEREWGFRVRGHSSDLTQERERFLGRTKTRRKRGMT